MSRRRVVIELAAAVGAVAIEVYLYRAYDAQAAPFHWFTHFFVGGAVALLVMAAVTWRTRRPVPLPLVWPVLGHLYAMTPDLLFTAGYAHERWMNVFLGHLSTHFIPGRNVTWYAIWLASLAVYLAALARRVPEQRAGRAPGAASGG